MYSYSYDPKTGGILLNPTSSDGKMSKEPRPVYAAELDLLGFGDVWKYDAQNEAPYLWAEANVYYYRGRKVASLKGGNLYEAPEIVLEKDENGADVEPEPNGRKLRPVDLKKMCAANAKTLEIVENATVKKIKNVYEKRRGKLDCFHVAFSGGKDSVVLLDLARKTLPRDGYVVLFADTGMEFPDTYETVEATRRACEADGVAFHVAKSRMTPEESWAIFGPPSRALRWCCSVHKGTPQVLKLRELTHKTNYCGLSYVGVRQYESIARSHYDYESYGKKQKGQFSHNPILEWTSAEIWLYIYANNCLVNEAYKKGCARIGCICCPMGGGKAAFVERENYSELKERYLNMIVQSNARSEIKDTEYALSGWLARKNGRYLTSNSEKYSEVVRNNELTIVVKKPQTDWQEWIKTLGLLFQENGKFGVDFQGSKYFFEVTAHNNQGYTVRLPEAEDQDSRHFEKLFRCVFRRAAFCAACQTCQANCKHNCISFKNGVLKIENCRRCLECYDITAGCLAYDSLKIPNAWESKVSKKTYNCFSNHALQTKWLKNFFEKNEIVSDDMGQPQKTKFKRFLKDAELIDDGARSFFGDVCDSVGWDSEVALGLMLINLVANNPQMELYVKEMPIGYEMPTSVFKARLQNTFEQSEDNVSSIVASFKRFADKNIFGTTLNFGRVDKDGKDEYLTRTKCVVSEPLVVLYGLFKFAEKCGDYKQFRLSVLLDDEIERDGVSPTRIFGLDREEMIPILNGLAAKYPEFIYASFTHDLEKITLADDKTSADVLRLF